MSELDRQAGTTQATLANVKLATSATALKESAVAQTDSADRRTELAADRTVLAAERTYAAWMRTGLAALASAIGSKALLEGHVPGWLVRSASVVLVVFAAFCFIAGVWRQIDPGAPPPRPDVRTLPRSVLLAFNGFFVVLCLAVLVGFLLI